MFYFAIISAITPPVCAAVYVAAAIARANWVRTGFIATKLGLAGFIAPYMFVYSPALLLQGPWWEVTWATITASVGVIALAAGSMGYFVRPATLPERAALIAAALLLIKPGLYTDAAGVVLLVAVTVLQRRRWPLVNNRDHAPGRTPGTSQISWYSWAAILMKRSAWLGCTVICSARNFAVVSMRMASAASWMSSAAA